MGKVMSLINTTPDGFIDARYTIADAEFYDCTRDLLKDIGTIAFGRNTFELFQNRWPVILEKRSASESQLKMAKTLNDMHKVVYSSTLATTTWNNSSIVRRIEREEINNFKRQGDRGMLTLGSPALVEALTEMDLIDDYYFFIQPVIAGTGIRLFDNANPAKSRSLTFVESKQLRSGVHILHYKTQS